MRCFVYVLRDPRNGAIRYVGITHNPHRRLRQHVLARKARTGRHVRSWVLHLRRRMMVPQMEIQCEFPSREQACMMELLMIAELKKQGAKLVNSTDGGEL